MLQKIEEWITIRLEDVGKRIHIRADGTWGIMDPLPQEKLPSERIRELCAKNGFTMMNHQIATYIAMGIFSTMDPKERMDGLISMIECALDKKDQEWIKKEAEKQG